MKVVTKCVFFFLHFMGMVLYSPFFLTPCVFYVTKIAWFLFVKSYFILLKIQQLTL